MQATLWSKNQRRGEENPSPGSDGGLGGFGALCTAAKISRAGAGSGTDGVGTKLRLAMENVTTPSSTWSPCA